MSFSVNKMARVGGLLYLLIIIIGIVNEMFLRGKFIISGDAATTSNNIKASLLLWRISVANDIIMHVCDVPLMIILYVLLKPVNKRLALLALIFTAIQTAVMVSSKLSLFTPVFLAADTAYLKAFNVSRLQALSYLSVRLDSYGFGVGLIFFAFACIINGYLIFRSTFLPKAIGILMQIAGICYLINSMSLILAPHFADSLFPAILLPCFIAELSLCLWLLIKGINTSRWKICNQAGEILINQD